QDDENVEKEDEEEDETQESADEDEKEDELPQEMMSGPQDLIQLSMRVMAENEERLEQLRVAAVNEPIDPQIEELDAKWGQLEKTMDEKAKKQFIASRQELYARIADMKEQAQQLRQKIMTEIESSDIPTVNVAMQNQEMIETHMADLPKQEVGGLQRTLDEFFPKKNDETN
ncbi:hypothetical protein PENTCL1PPCAC_10280, partial [Pristionchus entomophagus]